MATSPRAKPWSRADLDRLPDDGNRYEVLDGELFVTPLPWAPHQSAALVLAAKLHAYCTAHNIGVVFAPGAVQFGKNELQPDVMMVPPKARPLPRDWKKYGVPLVVIEVLSDATRRRDHVEKRDAYVQLRIPEYWIVDIDDRTVTVVRPGVDDEIVSDVLHWHPQPDIAALEIQLSEVFN